jgi:O-antigen/teichoic acid export membrane protein
LKLKLLAQTLSLTPFDKSTEQGRALERYRLSAWGSIANIASSGMAFLALIITVPLTLPYLGDERFGVWMTVSSFAVMLTFLDLGVGNGLVSYIAKTGASGNMEEFRRAVTRGLLLLTLVGGGAGVVLAILNTLWPLQDVIAVDLAEAREDARKAAWMFIFLFSLGIPFSGVYRVYNGLQKSWVVNTYRSLASIVSIVCVVILARFEAPPHLLLLATYGVQVLTPLILLCHIFRKNWISTDPHGDREQAGAAYRELLSTGGFFLVLQVGTMVGWGADSFIISSLAGAAAVTQFAIAQRLYQLVSLPLSIINGPLWAAYADAKAHSDSAFITRTLQRSLLGTLCLSSVLSLVIFLASGLLLEMWIGGEVAVSPSLLLAFSVWKIMEATGTAFSMFLNGMHMIKLQVVSVLLFCLLALPLKLYYVPEFGANAIVWSTVFAYSLAVIAFYTVVFRKVILGWKSR